MGTSLLTRSGESKAGLARFYAKSQGASTARRRRTVGRRRPWFDEELLHFERLRRTYFSSKSRGTEFRPLSRESRSETLIGSKLALLKALEGPVSGHADA